MSLFMQILFIVIVVVLFVVAIAACVRFGKGTADTRALKDELLQLIVKFENPFFINPRKERESMEILQNQIKTSSNPSVISNDRELKDLFHNNRQYIQSWLDHPDLDNRTDWIKFNALMKEFDTRYFPASVQV
jgi:RNA recognition motif-containing protein